MKNGLILFFLTAFWYTQAQSGDEIVKNIYTASGGWEKWSKVKSLRFSGDYLMGPGALAPVMNLITTQPCLCSREDFSWAGMTSTTVYQTDSGWSYNPFGGKRTSDPLNEEQLRTYKLASDPQGLLFNYAQKNYTIDYLGMDDFEGVDVHRLRLLTPDGDMLYYDIDAGTGLILRTITKIILTDKEVRNEVVYSNYQTTDFGIKLPMTIEWRNENGATTGTIKYSSAQVNAEVNMDEFKRKM